MVFSFGTATTTGGFSLPAATTTAASTGFTLGSGDAGNISSSLPLASTTASVASSTALAQKTPTTAVGSMPSSTGFVNFSLPSASTAGSTASGATTQTSAATTTTAASGGGAHTFVQLEESINKWAMELEEQERVFVNQASQVNAWDRLLIANGDKIVNLNGAVERVKLEQQQLDHELDFIRAQQRDLEDCLGPLERQLLPAPTSADPERERTYQLAENVDTQLKQMTEDLKEVIEHLNEANRVKDATDPMVQVGRILNAHMNSLQWLDQKTAAIATLVDEVSKLHDAHKRENERSFHLTYDR
ncbi:nuclear pore glycoprotein p62 [Bacillus rossius redtenbacheri]|uniref:nuclear pore glycoprotein p62 n=1 Tax=Bacillus rossius redtenbacheri TaxID=93214 RepID=UPI002FDC7F13